VTKKPPTTLIVARAIAIVPKIEVTVTLPWPEIRIAPKTAIPEIALEPKVQLCRELGADLALNYRTQDVDAAIREFAPQGVNVWWETLREPDFDRVVSQLALRGRMVLMGERIVSENLKNTNLPFCPFLT